MDKGKRVVSDIKRAMPMAPPSINKLGNKKPFSPKPAEKMPTSIKIVSLTKCVILLLKISTSLIVKYSIITMEPIQINKKK